MYVKNSRIKFLAKGANTTKFVRASFHPRKSPAVHDCITTMIQVQCHVPVYYVHVTGIRIGLGYWSTSTILYFEFYTYMYI